MYNTKTIVDYFLEDIGWRNDEGYLQDLVTSTSGMFYNDEHPMLVMENLKQISDLYDDWKFVDLVDKPKNGVYVFVREQHYITLKDTTGFTDNTNDDLDVQDATMFKKVDLFTEWIKRRTSSGIMGVIDDWMNDTQQVVSLIDSGDVFRFVEKKVTTNGGLVFKSKRQGVQNKINEISIWLETENQTFDITITDSYGDTRVQNVVYTKGKQAIEVDWDLEPLMEYVINHNATGNTITYSNAVDNKYYSVKGWDGTIETNYNYGIGLHVTTGCDLTEFIIKNARRFRRLIVMGVAIRLIKEMLYNPNMRVNRRASNIHIAELRYELEGGDLHKGLVVDYRKSMQRLKLETNGLSKDCLPCKKTGVKYGTIK